MNSQEESINIKYSNGDTSITVIARGVDSTTLSCILEAVRERNFSYLKKLKESFNFECIVIDNGSETLV